MPAATTVVLVDEAEVLQVVDALLGARVGLTMAPPSKVLNTLVAWKLSTDRSPCLQHAAQPLLRVAGTPKACAAS
jgi:hypothetical protein